MSQPTALPPTTLPQRRGRTLWRFFGRPAAKLFLFLAIVFAVGVVTCELVARHYEHAADVALVPGASSLSEFSRSLRKSDANETARALEGLAARMGVDLAPKPMKDRARPDDAAKKGFEAVKQHLKSYLSAANRRADDLVMALPSDVKEFLDQHERVLFEVREALLSAEPPTWEADPAKGWDAPVPNLVGQLALHQLLLSKAFRELGRGQDAEALTWVNASWRLAQDTWERGETISYLIALSAQRGQLQALRIADEVPPEPWQSRFARLDPQKSYVRTVRQEALGAMTSARDPKNSDFGDLVWWLRPYIRAGLAEHAVREQWVARDLEKLRPCEANPLVIEKIWARPWPWWNIPGKVAWPSMAGAASRTAHRELDLELSALVLALKNGAAVPNPYPSRSCPEQFWTWQRSNSGHLESVEFSYKPHEVYNKELWELPLRFVSRRQR